MRNILYIYCAFFRFNCKGLKEEIKDSKELRTWELDNKTCVGQVINQVQDSLWICKYANGRKASEGMYIMGKKDGLHQEWYESGSLKSQVFYNEDVLNGSCKSYYENGQMKYLSNMRNNVPVGDFSFWYPNGVLTIKGTSKDNIFQYFEINDSTGKSMVKNGDGRFILNDKESNIQIVGEIKHGIVKQPYFHYSDGVVIDTIYSKNIF